MYTCEKVVLLTLGPFDLAVRPAFRCRRFVGSSAAAARPLSRKGLSKGKAMRTL